MEVKLSLDGVEPAAQAGQKEPAGDPHPALDVFGMIPGDERRRPLEGRLHQPQLLGITGRRADRWRRLGRLGPAPAPRSGRDPLHRLLEHFSVALDRRRRLPLGTRLRARVPQPDAGLPEHAVEIAERRVAGKASVPLRPGHGAPRPHFRMQSRVTRSQ